MFTAIGTFGVNNAAGIETVIYEGSSVTIDGNVADERFELIKRTLNSVK